jgi:hypothetical protein
MKKFIIYEIIILGISVLLLWVFNLTESWVLSTYNLKQLSTIGQMAMFCPTITFIYLTGVNIYFLDKRNKKKD